MLVEVDIRYVAELLLDGQGKPVPACLLIGAGVSKSAGVGLANDFVRTIKANHPAAYQRAISVCKEDRSPSYGECMAMLTPAQQTQLVRSAIETARVNWAHIGIALLEQAGFINSILTTNFDPLASRACALFNRFPAIYDLAGLRDIDGGRGLQFDRSFVSGTAIYHLHGQHTGFLLLNTAEKLAAQADRIAPVLNATMIGKPVIICGYSGDNDPLVRKIAALGPFPYGLVWVTHDNKEPPEFVRQVLLEQFEACYFVRNAPADRFFDQLFRALGVDPPQFLSKPFDHMLSVLDTVAPYHPSDSRSPDLIAKARERLISARDSERSDKPESAALSDLVAEEKYEEAWERYGGADKEKFDAESRDLIAWSAVMLGNALLETASEPDAPKDTYKGARQLYREALSWNGESEAAYFNLGLAYLREAERSAAPAEDDIWLRAEENFQRSAELEPHQEEAFVSWGNTLSRRAPRPGETQDGLYARAVEKFELAIGHDPDSYRALNNLGNVFLEMARRQEGEDRARSLSEAIKSCARAESIKKGYGSYNLACAYSQLGNLDEAQKWLRMAFEHGEAPECSHILSDPDLVQLRARETFRQLSIDIGCPPES